MPCSTRPAATGPQPCGSGPANSTTPGGVPDGRLPRDGDVHRFPPSDPPADGLRFADRRPLRHRDGGGRMRTTDLFAWQFDGHRVVVAEDPHGDLEITPYCPGLADGATPWCRVPQNYGGLLRSTLDPASWCAFDHWWSDPPGD